MQKLGGSVLSPFDLGNIDDFFNNPDDPAHTQDFTLDGIVTHPFVEEDVNYSPLTSHAIATSFNHRRIHSAPTHSDNSAKLDRREREHLDDAESAASGLLTMSNQRPNGNGSHQPHQLYQNQPGFWTNNGSNPSANPSSSGQSNPTTPTDPSTQPLYSPPQQAMNGYHSVQGYGQALDTRYMGPGSQQAPSNHLFQQAFQQPESEESRLARQQQLQRQFTHQAQGHQVPVLNEYTTVTNGLYQLPQPQSFHARAIGNNTTGHAPFPVIFGTDNGFNNTGHYVGAYPLSDPFARANGLLELPLAQEAALSGNRTTFNDRSLRTQNGYHYSAMQPQAYPYGDTPSTAVSGSVRPSSSRRRSTNPSGEDFGLRSLGSRDQDDVDDDNIDSSQPSRKRRRKENSDDDEYVAPTTNTTTRRLSGRTTSLQQADEDDDPDESPKGGRRQPDDPDQDKVQSGGSGKKKAAKKARVVLKDDEKRKRHISSEQRRRDIKVAMLAAMSNLTPALNGGKAGYTETARVLEIADYTLAVSEGNRNMMRRLGIRDDELEDDDEDADLPEPIQEEDDEEEY